MLPVRLGRRGLLALGAGAFAPAGAGAADQEVSIPVGAGSFWAYRSLPAGSGPAPVALVAGNGPVSDVAVADVCQRLAAAGYLALAGHGDGSEDDLELLTRLDAAAAWAAANGGAPGRLFMTGFGRGGRLAWLFAAQAPQLRAAVAWGSTAGSGQRRGPLDVAPKLRAPVLGLYGAEDAANPRSALLDLEQKGRSSGQAVEIVTYAGASADFGLDGQPGNDEAAALDGWKRMLGWFRRFGGR